MLVSGDILRGTFVWLWHNTLHFHLYQPFTSAGELDHNSQKFRLKILPIYFEAYRHWRGICVLWALLTYYLMGRPLKGVLKYCPFDVKKALMKAMCVHRKALLSHNFYSQCVLRQHFPPKVSVYILRHPTVQKTFLLF